MQRYDSYKPSGIYFLSEFPSGWKIRKGKYLFKEENRPVHPGDEIVTCFRDGQVTLRKNRRVEGFTNSLKEIGYQGVRKGDLVIHNMDAFAGAIGISDSDGKATPVYSCCTPQSAEISQYYYCYLLRYLARNGFILSLAKGIRERSTDFRFNDFKELYLPVPSRAEQDAIVSYLDTATAKIDSAIAQQQKMIDLLNERKQIIINNAVTKGLNPNAKMKDSGVEWIGEIPEGWECRKLKSICANTQYSIKTGPFGSQLKGDDIQEFGDVPIYNQRVVIDNDCCLFNSYVSKAKAVSLKSFVVNSKDLLITTRGTIGKSTIVPNDAPEGILHPCIIAIRLNFDLCFNEYLQFFFQSVAFNTDMMLKSNATTIEVIYSYNLKECFVPLPPIDEQKQIVEYLNEELVRINQTIDATTNQISLLQERKQIIINEVVTGKVKVI